MRRLGLLLLILLVLAVQATCNGSKEKVNDNSPTPVTSPDLDPQKRGAVAEIGVRECDEFIQKYKACVQRNIPVSGQASYDKEIEAWRTSWQAQAVEVNSEAIKRLAETCKNVAEDKRKAMSKYDCDF